MRECERDDGRSGEGRLRGDMCSLLAKLHAYRDSLRVIEDWIDGHEPRGLALAFGPSEFAHASRRPLTIDTVDRAIRRER